MNCLDGREQRRHEAGFWVCFKVQSTAKLTPSVSLAISHIRERVTKEIVIIL